MLRRRKLEHTGRNTIDGSAVPTIHRRSLTIDTKVHGLGKH